MLPQEKEICLGWYRPKESFTTAAAALVATSLKTAVRHESPRKRQKPSEGTEYL